MSKTDEGPFPQVHPRADHVERARVAYAVRLLHWQQEFQLTACESLEIITRELHHACAGYLRTERAKDSTG